MHSFSIFALALILLLPACGRAGNHAEAPAGPSRDLGAIAFQEALAATAAPLLLDVRTPGEFATGHLAGAINLDIHDPAFREKAAALDSERPLFVYCRSGNRSSHAIRILADLGRNGITHLACGIRCWQSSGLPLTREKLSP